MIIDYGNIIWDTGDASGGVNGLAAPQQAPYYYPAGFRVHPAASPPASLNTTAADPFQPAVLPGPSAPATQAIIEVAKNTD